MRQRITVVSPFRDASEYIDGYIEQINSLDYLPELIRVICIEGDSTDDTRQKIEQWMVYDDRVTLVKHDTGRRKYPSLVLAERFVHLAEVFNAGLDAVDLDWSDYVQVIPGDTLFEPSLISQLVEADKDVIAPYFWTGHGQQLRFYDLWGFTKEGKQFKPYPPIWYSQNFPAEPFECDTIGGAALIKAEVLRDGCRYTPQEVDHGLCKCAKKHGYTVWAHPGAHIVHR